MSAFNNSENNHPSICIICDLKDLAIEVIKVLHNDFDIDLVSREKLSEIYFQKNFGVRFLDLRNNKEKALERNYDYILCIANSGLVANTYESTLDGDEEKIRLAQKLSLKQSPKSLFVFSQRQKESDFLKVSSLIESILEDRNIYAGVLLLGDIISDYEKSQVGYFSLLLRDLAQKNYTRLPKDPFTFYPISIAKAGRALIRSLLSLSVYGKVIKVVTKKYSSKRIQKIFQNLVPNAKVFYYIAKKEIFLQAKEDIYLKEDIKRYLKRVIEDFELSRDKKPIRASKVQELVFLIKSILKKLSNFVGKISDKTGKNFTRVSFLSRWKAILGLSIFFAIVSPFLFLFLTIPTLFISRQTLRLGLLDPTQKVLLFSSSLSKLTDSYSSFLAPFLRSPYKETQQIASIIFKITDVAQRDLKIRKTFINYSDSILDTKDYDPYLFSEKISLELDLIYKELGFLEVDIKESGNIGRWLFEKFLYDKNIYKFHEKNSALQVLVKEIPSLLGKEGQKSYLILFQNNTSITPAGGLIEAIGVITFSAGKLTDLKIYETIDIDKNLQGLVEPPSSLKNFSEEDSWNLKDSGWDTNFPISAEAAEWFLDKELDISVDGVVALDVEFIKRLLSITGDLKLDKEKVTSKNIYTKISGGQELSVELFRTFVNNVMNLNPSQRLRVLNLMPKLLEEKHLMFFLHNTPSQEALSSLNWAGSVKNLECSKNCYSDLVGIAEAGRGISGNLIVREADISVSIEEGVIKRKLTLFFENPSEINYKTYIAVLANSDSGFGPVQIIGQEGDGITKSQNRGLKGYKESGVLVEIPAKKAKKVVYYWESGSTHNFQEAGEYKLYLRKQPGMWTYPFKVRIKVPKGLIINSDPRPSLTDGVQLIYNTQLSQDTDLNIFWSKHE